MLLALCCSFALASNDDLSPLESGDIRAVYLSAPAEARVEYFVLTTEVGEPHAVARFARWPLAGGGERLEFETRLLSSNHWVSHVERHEPGRRLLTWRERSAAGVRSVYLDGDEELVGWIGEGRRSRRVAVEAGAVLPLEWLRDALDGDSPAAVACFDPLSASVRQLNVRAEEAPEAATRWTWTEREQSCESWCTDEAGLASFVWRSKHVRARRISSVEHAAFLAEIAVETAEERPGSHGTESE